MARFGFPPVIEMSDELVGLIAADCGYAESSSDAALRRGVPVLVALGLCPELPFRKLADACWGEGLKQKELKSIVEMLMDRDVVTFTKPYYSLKEPPAADRVARWLDDTYFSLFLEKIKEWSRYLVEKSTSRLPRKRIEAMYAGVYWGQVIPPDAPDFISPYPAFAGRACVGVPDSAGKCTASGFVGLQASSAFFHVCVGSEEVVLQSAE